MNASNGPSKLAMLEEKVAYRILTSHNIRLVGGEKALQLLFRSRDRRSISMQEDLDRESR